MGGDTRDVMTMTCQEIVAILRSYPLTRRIQRSVINDTYRQEGLIDKPFDSLTGITAPVLTCLIDTFVRQPPLIPL